MCDKAVDSCRAPLKLIAGWFITSKILENDLFVNYDILHFNEDFSKITFYANQMDYSCCRSW